MTENIHHNKPMKKSILNSINELSSRDIPSSSPNGRKAINLSGIGDPYWYEWTVGLTYIVNMLNPDSGISSVSFQAENISGWEDIVVEYSSGKTNYYQIKHTRTDNTITFGDLVSSTNNKSLLSYLSQCWKKNKDQNSLHPDSRFIIYSNKRLGKRKTSGQVHGKTIQRPPLKDFFDEIKAQSKMHNTIDSFEIKNEYLDAYRKEFLPQLQGLNNNEKLLFLQQLELKMEEPNLIELENRLTKGLSKCFGITKIQAKSVFESLDHVLREWTTSTRMKSQITKEDVYEALRKPAEERVGEHNLDPPTPFFASRDSTITELIKDINDKNNKIVFLTGNPGIGKTSLISKLSNNRNPFIHLRYYTFKPISPDNDLLPVDSGKTCYSRSLWGDLLSQLRDKRPCHFLVAPRSMKIG